MLKEGDFIPISYGHGESPVYDGDSLLVQSAIEAVDRLGWIEAKETFLRGESNDPDLIEQIFAQLKT